MKYVLIDSTFWIDLFDSRSEQIKEDVEAKHDLIQGQKWIVPIPTFYETIRTRFVRNKIGMVKLEQLIKKPNVILLQDHNYASISIEETIHKNNYNGRQISLVDMIIRNIIKDINIKIDYLVTQNEKDFLDVCAQRQITII